VGCDLFSEISDILCEALPIAEPNNEIVLSSRNGKGFTKSARPINYQSINATKNLELGSDKK
jgi:hypothetical protein